MVVLQFIAMTILPSVISVFLIILRKNNCKTSSKYPFSILAGLLFGLCAVYGTEFGVDTGMAILNTRDASVICAGLYFGWPAAIMSAVIGSVERYLAPLWGTGAYTRMACSIATLCAGFFSGFLSKFVFKERPKWFQGALCGLFIEVFHMLMVFVTHPTDLHTAFTVIQKTSVPMILMNSVAVVFAIVMVDIVEKTKFSLPDNKTIAVQFNYGLSMAMILGFAVSIIFTAKLEKTVSLKDTENLLLSNLQDIEHEIANGNNLADSIKFRRIGTDGYVIIADEDYINGLGQSLVLNRAVINGVDSFFLYDKYLDSYLIAVISTYEARFSEKVTVSLSIFTELLVFAILYLMILFLVRKLVINNVEQVNKDLKKITEGNLEVKLKIDTNKEFLSLSAGINSTVDKLKDLIAEASARIDAELEFARQIQLESLPSAFEAFPERKDFDIYASMNTAKEVGGDFYDFFFTEKNKLFFMIADVSGKGIPAAMFMMRAKTLIRQIAEKHSNVSDIAVEANNLLCLNNDAGLFVTAWLGSLDLETGILQYVNAGHNPPVLLRKNKSPEYLQNRSGLVLAGMEGMRYKQFELELKSGDIVFLYTDGVTEAADSDNNLFGDDRLLDVFSKTEKNDCQSLCKEVLGNVNCFVGNAEQFDDITLMSVGFNGKQKQEKINDN